MKPGWHALLAPLPDDALIQRKPVLPPELEGKPGAEAIAGWQSLIVWLSAGESGSRNLLVMLDASGTPISAGDWVVYRRRDGDEVTWIHESIGGRLEPDGRFLGTRWHTVAVGPLDSDQAETREQQKSEPGAQDVAALKALVAELLRRC